MQCPSACAVLLIMACRTCLFQAAKHWALTCILAFGHRRAGNPPCRLDPRLRSIPTPQICRRRVPPNCRPQAWRIKNGLFRPVLGPGVYPTPEDFGLRVQLIGVKWDISNKLVIELQGNSETLEHVRPQHRWCFVLHCLCAAALGGIIYYHIIDCLCAGALGGIIH